MLRHIVMFRMRAKDASQNLHTLKDKLEALKNKIPEVHRLETGINISKSPSAFDLVLITEFSDEASLQIYREHPDHRQVLQFIRENTEELKVVDHYF